MCFVNYNKLSQYRVTKQTHIREDSGVRTGTFSTTVHRDYSSVIAAIPIMALLALCIMAALVTLFAAAFRTVGPHGATPAVFAPAGKERMSRAPAHPIHVLRWEAMHLLLLAGKCEEMLSVS